MRRPPSSAPIAPAAPAPFPPRALPLLPLLLLPLMLAAAPQRRLAAQAQRGEKGAVSAPVSDARYEVTADAAATGARRLHVAMTFTASGKDPVLLSLPAWTPGAYEITGFAKWVASFAARGADGRALEWDKWDYDTWRVRPTGKGAVTVSFDYLADSLDNAMSWTRPDFALFNGTNLFLYPEGRSLDFPATVTVRTQPGWLVATGMAPATATAAAGSDGRAGDQANSRTFGASNYHDLVDMPFFVGVFDLDSVRVAMPPAIGGERWVRLATYPAGSVAGARRAAALRWIERTIPPEAAVFGETPWSSYTVMQIADSSYGGASGLEHQNSHVDVITPLAIDNPIIAGLYAHEIFHAWNVKRLRPAELVPYRYDAAQPTPLLWVSEGITDYYADLAQVRGGLVDSAGFARLLAGKIDNVAAAPPTALEDASLSTWVHPTDGSDYLYYPKGSVVGFLLDVMIRDASDNRRSLDDVMRDLYVATYKKGQGFTNDQWWAAVSRAAGGRSFADFSRRYVDGREELPYATVLPLAGFRVAADTVREPRLGIGTGMDSSGAVVVQHVEPRGALEAAGVRVGDVLLAVGDVPVSDADFGPRFRAKYASAAPGTRLPVRVRRDGQSLTLDAALAFVPRVARRVEIDPRASAKAARIRSGVLHGTTER